MRRGSSDSFQQVVLAQVEAMVDPQKGAAWSQPWLKL